MWNFEEVSSNVARDLKIGGERVLWVWRPINPTDSRGSRRDYPLKRPKDWHPKNRKGQKRGRGWKINFQRPPPSRHLKHSKLPMNHISYYRKLPIRARIFDDLNALQLRSSANPTSIQKLSFCLDNQSLLTWIVEGNHCPKLSPWLLLEHPMSDIHWGLAICSLTIQFAAVLWRSFGCSIFLTKVRKFYWGNWVYLLG